MKIDIAKAKIDAINHCGLRRSTFSSLQLLQSVCKKRRQKAQKDIKKYPDALPRFIECLACRYADLIDMGLLPPDLNIKISNIEQHTTHPAISSAINFLSTHPAISSAINFLFDILRFGPRRQSIIKLTAKQKGITWRTLRRAKKISGIRSIKGKESFSSAWWWEMPARQYRGQKEKNDGAHKV